MVADKSILENWIEEQIKDKKVLILGFGREGQSTYELIQTIGGYDVLGISDCNPVKVDDEKVKLHTGADYQKCLNDYDIVIKSPGIVLEQEIGTYTCQMLSQTEIFFTCYKKQIIGITGTKGKSTTTTLLHHVLKQAGKEAVLAGNIGIPAFGIVNQIKENSVIAFEMSSHMLEYMTVAPQLGVYLNVHEEHLDHYGTMEKYVAAKENIYRNQKAGDMLYCNIENMPDACESDVVMLCHYATQERSQFEQLKEQEVALLEQENDVRSYTVKAILGVCESCIYYAGQYIELPVDEIGLLGNHNYFDIGVVYAICKEYDIDDEVFVQALKTYETLPHRLQYFGTFGGVRFYDDSISTICDTAIAALESVKNADTILIGGMDRGIDYEELIRYLSEHPVSHIILMAATGKRIYEQIISEETTFENKERLIVVETLEEAVAEAKKCTATGKSCILSPAAASYGIFKDFNERGEVFQQLVKKVYDDAGVR